MMGAHRKDAMRGKKLLINNKYKNLLLKILLICAYMVKQHYSTNELQC